jgi:hypothetical protein
MFWGPSPACLARVASAAADQLAKLWLIYSFDLGGRGLVTRVSRSVVTGTPASATACSAGGRSGHGIAAVKALAVGLLWIWLGGFSRLPGGLAGLIMAAPSAAVDRLRWPGVMDFRCFTPRWGQQVQLVCSTSPIPSLRV